MVRLGQPAKVEAVVWVVLAEWGREALREALVELGALQVLVE